MPTYDYKCNKCNTVIEVFHKMNESPKIVCNSCGLIMEKSIGKGAGIIFKGSGFYTTDYKKKENKDD